MEVLLYSPNTVDHRKLRHTDRKVPSDMTFILTFTKICQLVFVVMFTAKSGERTYTQSLLGGFWRINYILCT
jgi:hypothetical protein